jgi:hypothetical protein
MGAAPSSPQNGFGDLVWTLIAFCLLSLKAIGAASRAVDQRERELEPEE